MQVIRTIVWVLLLIAAVSLTLLNWETTLAMRIWPGIVWDTRLPAIIVVAFLLGLVPMWLVHRGSLWRHRRRIALLETNQRATVGAITTPAAPSPVPPARTEEPLAPEGPVEGAPVPRDEILR